MNAQETAGLAALRRLLDQPGSPAFRAGIDAAVLAFVLRDLAADDRTEAMIRELWAERAVHLAGRSKAGPA